MPASVSVIVPTRNNRSTIEECLRSICNQQVPVAEILVVNDGSTDDTLHICQRVAATDSRVRVLQNRGPRGAAAARNVGVRAAESEILAFIDGDIYADPGWLQHLLAPLLAGDADCTGGPDVVPVDDPLIARCVGYAMDSPLTTAGLRYGRARLVNYLPGTGNMALWSRIQKDVGLFNEFFHDSGEDKEFLYRVLHGGFRIHYVDDARVWHHRTTSLLVHARKMYYSGVRRVDIWRQLYRTLEVAHVIPALLAVLLISMPVWLASPDAQVRTQIQTLLGAAVTLLGIDAIVGAWTLRDLRALLVIPFASFGVVFGYGFGTIVGLATWLRTSVLRKT